MSNKSIALRKADTKKQQKRRAAMTQQEYRAHYERRLRGEKFKGLIFGMTVADIAQALQVSVATVRRWKAGTCQPPFMALELLRLRRGLALPNACGDFAGFMLGRVDGKTVLIPPYSHWSDGITATDVKSWGLYRNIVADAHAKSPAFAGLRHAGKLPANDAFFLLPVNTLSLEAIKQQTTDNRSGDGQ